MKLKHIAIITIAFALPAAALIGQEEAGGLKDPTNGNNSKMTEMHQKMEAEAKAQDTELEQLVTAMNSATGDKKTEAVAAVVAKLVEQRKEMRAKMRGMDGDMMAAMECCKGKMGTMSAMECCKAGMGTMSAMECCKAGMGTMNAMDCCKAGMGTMNATDCCKAGMGKSTDATGKPASSPMPIGH